MELKTLQRIAVDALEDVKAQDIQVYDTLGQTSEFDRVIVASGNSNRQTRALAWSVVHKVKEAGGHVIGVEGADTGEWVLVDLGDIVVHIMVPPVRAYYALEEIWGAKPVRTRQPEKRPAPKKPAARPAVRKSAVKKPSATKARAKKAPPKRKPSAPKKAAPRKATAKGKTARKTQSRATSTRTARK